MYEVEIRFVVDQADEAFGLLPFFQESLGAAKSWTSEIIGEAIFHEGHLLRCGRIDVRGGISVLGYKGVDQGEVANIRAEWGEEITHGAVGSEILRNIGIEADFATPDDLLGALAQAGHHPFMRFAGEDQLGFYEPLQLHTKLCRCADIVGDSYLIELELEAATLDEARAAEKKLIRLAKEYNLMPRLIRDEPPTMLFKAYQARNKESR